MPGDCESIWVSSSTSSGTDFGESSPEAAEIPWVFRTKTTRKPAVSHAPATFALRNIIEVYTRSSAWVEFDLFKPIKNASTPDVPATQVPINAVVSMGRRNTQLRPTFFENKCQKPWLRIEQPKPCPGLIWAASLRLSVSSAEVLAEHLIRWCCIDRLNRQLLPDIARRTYPVCRLTDASVPGPLRDVQTAR